MNNVTKILAVLVAISAISFSSCKKVDPLLGTWAFVDAKLDINSSDPTVKMMSGLIDINSYIEMPNPIIFNEDGTGSGVTSSVTTQFDYTKTDSQITFKNLELFFGGIPITDLIADYQLLDKNMTLKLSLDVTDIAMPLFRAYLVNYINSSPIPLPIDVDAVMASIVDIKVIATYKK